jgi:hypothetical protein
MPVVIILLNGIQLPLDNPSIGTMKMLNIELVSNLILLFKALNYLFICTILPVLNPMPLTKPTVA